MIRLTRCYFFSTGFLSGGASRAMKPVCQSPGENNYFRVKRITSIMEEAEGATYAALKVADDSEAWLFVSLAVCDSARERKKSTTIDTPITPKAQALAITTCSSCSVSRLTASQTTTPDNKKSRQFPPAPKCFRSCRARNDAQHRPACGKLVQPETSSPWRRDQSASGRPCGT